jgi:HD-GYP domain-containing protein (c-di-GMP phosphodiesterase class II)
MGTGPITEPTGDGGGLIRAVVLDALTSEHPDQTAFGIDQAMATMREEPRRHVDPARLDHFLTRVDEVVTAERRHRGMLSPVLAVSSAPFQPARS